MANNTEIKQLLKRNDISYIQLGELIGLKPGTIKTMMSKPLSPYYDRIIRDAVKQRNIRNNLKLGGSYAVFPKGYFDGPPEEITHEGLASKTDISELNELCEDVLELNGGYNAIIRQIRNDAADDNFTESECKEYIDYLKEVAFNERIKR